MISEQYAVTAATWLLLSCLFFTSKLSAQPLPSAPPDQLGLSSERMTKIDAHFRTYVDAHQIPGVVIAVARRGKLAHFKSMGFQNIADKTPISDNTIFRIASMTKLITSVAVLMLFEEGHFQLSDPVSIYIPEFKDMQVLVDKDHANGPTMQTEREMTIHDLLTHTSGLGMTGSSGIDSLYAEAMGSPSLTLQQKMKAVGGLPLLYQPGSSWRYSMATTVLGYLVEVISGMPFEDFLGERIFAPLGMVDTGFFVNAEKSDRVISVYSVSESAGLELDGKGLADEETTPPKAPNGASGLFSTVNDYLQFSQMLLNGGALNGIRLLGKKTVDLMTIDHLPEDVALPAQFGRNYGLAGYGFGLGVRVRTNVARSKMPGSKGEYGWGGVFETYVLIDPEEALIAIYMTQVRPSSFYPLRREFTTMVYAALTD